MRLVRSCDAKQKLQAGLCTTVHTQRYRQVKSRQRYISALNSTYAACFIWTCIRSVCHGASAIKCTRQHGPRSIRTKETRFVRILTAQHLY